MIPKFLRVVNLVEVSMRFFNEYSDGSYDLT